MQNADGLVLYQANIGGRKWLFAAVRGGREIVENRLCLADNKLARAGIVVKPDWQCPTQHSQSSVQHSSLIGAAEASACISSAWAESPCSVTQ